MNRIITAPPVDDFDTFVCRAIDRLADEQNAEEVLHEQEAERLEIARLEVSRLQASTDARLVKIAYLRQARHALGSL